MFLLFLKYERVPLHTLVKELQPIIKTLNVVGSLVSFVKFALMENVNVLTLKALQISILPHAYAGILSCIFKNS